MSLHRKNTESWLKRINDITSKHVEFKLHLTQNYPSCNQISLSSTLTSTHKCTHHLCIRLCILLVPSFLTYRRPSETAPSSALQWSTAKKQQASRIVVVTDLHLSYLCIVTQTLTACNNVFSR